MTRTFIGSSRVVSAEQKAIWHHVAGAGKSRVRRKFFDLNEDDKQALTDGLGTLIAARLKRPTPA